MAKMELRIANDDGVPIPYADVDVFMGMNFRPKGYSITGRTDTNGVFIVKGKTCGDEIVVNIAKAGFYRTTKTFKFAEMGHEHEVKDGKWMPYGGIELMRLREKRHPASLRQFAFTHRPAPATNVWIGVDMEVGDFVKPYGTGIESDFELNVEWDGLPPPSSLPSRPASAPTSSPARVRQPAPSPDGISRRRASSRAASLPYRSSYTARPKLSARSPDRS